MPSLLFVWNIFLTRVLLKSLISSRSSFCTISLPTGRLACCTLEERSEVVHGGRCDVSLCTKASRMCGGSS